MKACISIGVVDSSYVLEGDIDVIKSMGRAKSNFRSIGADFEHGNKIIIPFSTENEPSEHDDSEVQYAAIQRLFKKFGIVYDKNESAVSFLSKIDKENGKFDIFSTKAKDIRNDIHTGDDFKKFTHIISCKMQRTLYKLQLLSAYHLAFSQNACNFSVPGAGKTSIVYGAYAYLNSLPAEHDKHVDRLLIISPLSAFSPWEDEYAECFGNTPTVKRLVGLSPLDRQNHFYSQQYTEITLISYNSASNLADVEHITEYLKQHRVMLILDEAHKIKNVTGGKWAEAVLSFARYASARVILTGTPAPNGYQDLYNLYKFIWPNKSLIKFPVQHLQYLTDNNIPSARQDVDKLIEYISPFFIRIRKAHLELPDPVENDPIYVPMGENQRRIYDYIEGEYVNYFQTLNSDLLAESMKKAKLIRLMQCMTNPNLLNKALDRCFEESEISAELNIDDRNIMQLIRSYDIGHETPPKFVKLLELVSQIIQNQGASGRVVIWTIFITNIFDLRKYLETHGIACEVLYGETPVENDDISDSMPTREKIIRDFHYEKCHYKVIIANPFAVGESISLHKACHNAIYLEKNFNAAVYMQSKDRIHRYGLQKNDLINYYYVLSENSIDEVIHEKILEKEQRMLRIIEGQDIPLLNLNMEDSPDAQDDDIAAIINHYYVRKNSSG